jgi:hypothetical protein
MSSLNTRLVTDFEQIYNTKTSQYSFQIPRLSIRFNSLSILFKIDAINRSPGLIDKLIS